MVNIISNMIRNLSVIANLVLIILYHFFSVNGCSDKLSNQLSSISYYQNSTECHAWFYHKSPTSECQCLPKPHFICDGKGNNTYVDSFYVLTFDREMNVVSASKLNTYRFFHHTNATKPGYRLLPQNISELNDIMCGPLNRKGYLCRDCIDGYGLAMTAFEHPYDCYKCSGNWHGVILYLILELIPVTLFYLVVLVFQFRLTSAPMTSFIMYSQLIVIEFFYPWEDNYENNMTLNFLFTEAGNLRAVNKLILVFYGIFNLDFILPALPPFCITSYMKLNHRPILGYITAFYPMLLILFTWIAIELHDRNYKVIVYLWRPFHRYFVQLRKGWNTKNDLIDVFANFFLLSYLKIMSQTLEMTSTTLMFTYSLSNGHSNYTYVLHTDNSISMTSSLYITRATFALLMSVIFNILPLLLLVMYPFRIFRRILSKFKLDRISLMIFMEKFHSCYRDGLDGRSDMRYFSGIYFFLEIALVLVVLLLSDIFHFSRWILRGMLFSITALLIALCRPYKQTYMNVSDSLLLTLLAFICYTFSSNTIFKYSVPVLQTILLFPFIILSLCIFVKTFYKFLNSHFIKSTFIRFKLAAMFPTKQVRNLQQVRMYGATS